jgi:FixJ family two-component response regulator
MTTVPTIFVVDDDAAVRKAVASAGKLLGYPVKAFASAAEFLTALPADHPGCLVLDVKMPGMTGLELQKVLADDGVTLPVVMISGHADVRIAVETMTLGAQTLLEKPFSLSELLEQMRRAIERDTASRAARGQADEAKARLASLTTKEREVLDYVSDGWTNKEIADKLGLSVRAVEDRRARLMRKVGAESLVKLIGLIGRK